MVRRNSRLIGPTRLYGLAGALKIGIAGKSSCRLTRAPAGAYEAEFPVGLVHVEAVGVSKSVAFSSPSDASMSPCSSLVGSAEVAAWMGPACRAGRYLAAQMGKIRPVYPGSGPLRAARSPWAASAEHAANAGHPRRLDVAFRA